MLGRTQLKIDKQKLFFMWINNIVEWKRVNETIETIHENWNWNLIDAHSILDICNRDSSSDLPRETIQLFRYLLYQSFLYLISLSDEFSISNVFVNIDIVMKNTLKWHSTRVCWNSQRNLMKFSSSPCISLQTNVSHSKST